MDLEKEKVSARTCFWHLLTRRSGPCYTGSSPRDPRRKIMQDQFLKKTQEVVKGLHSYYCRAAGGFRLHGHFWALWVHVNITAPLHLPSSAGICVRLPWGEPLTQFPPWEINMTDVALLEQAILVEMNGWITSEEEIKKCLSTGHIGPAVFTGLQISLWWHRAHSFQQWCYSTYDKEQIDVCQWGGIISCVTKSSNTLL